MSTRPARAAACLARRCRRSSRTRCASRSGSRSGPSASSPLGTFPWRFPPGVVNMLTGSGSVVGDGLVAHPDIRAISFTGGVETGKHVYESAAKKMIKVGLELGGKNPILALDDANIDLLMDGVMFGAFGN